VRSSTAPATRAWRFVTPICFEDIDPAMVAKMFRASPVPGDPLGKRVDFIVNITNDGWFKANENPQHLQAAIFRSIENRAPTARSVNTGISGFIDSTGHTSNLVPQGTEGTSIAMLMLDSRNAPFTSIGDLFADLCGAAAGLMAGAQIVRWWLRRRRNAQASSGASP
jgi:apolipoprotein N-acyltransferase